MSSSREATVGNAYKDGKTIAASLIRKCSTTRDPRGMAGLVLSAALAEAAKVCKLSSDKILERFPVLPALADAEASSTADASGALTL